MTPLQPWIAEIQETLQLAGSAGASMPVYFHPLMLGSHQSLFKGGVVFEVVKKNKKLDILAASGRWATTWIEWFACFPHFLHSYDHLIGRFSPAKQKLDAVCAVGLQISVAKITAALALFQSTSVKALIKEERSFGFWSPRR